MQWSFINGDICNVEQCKVNAFFIIAIIHSKYFLFPTLVPWSFVIDDVDDYEHDNDDDPGFWFVWLKVNNVSLIYEEINIIYKFINFILIN